MIKGEGTNRMSDDRDYAEEAANQHILDTGDGEIELPTEKKPLQVLSNDLQIWEDRNSVYIKIGDDEMRLKTDLLFNTQEVVIYIDEEDATRLIESLRIVTPDGHTWRLTEKR